ncbi:MAG: hypothetical protein ACLP8S_33250 [Solirubrobacteraceae bacterium]
MRVLLDHGPVMHLADLERVAVGEHGLRTRSFVVYLHNSPVLTRHAPCVYGLRGRRQTAPNSQR